MNGTVKILIGSALLLIGVVVLYKAITDLQSKGAGFGGNIKILSSSIIFILAGIYLIIESL
ncbi:hypothetical protein H9Q13_06795 [Pontibacter sp. JH31]|uniref:Uncharacterized protein n=1 Tax=Pontibacter aquaedesilientis TaxID=2766980 RepID=A0ABR7XHG7_9BACT|nr:hypothetical protein [Pontibacter aquaedesilientis]